MQTPKTAAYERWFDAAISKKNMAAALEITDQAKRARYHQSLSWGGRLAALRDTLEAPEHALSQHARNQRNELLLRYPEYDQAAKAGRKLESELREKWQPDADKKAQRALTKTWRAWSKNLGEREAMLGQIGLQRIPADVQFPPTLPTAALQSQLKPGQAVAVFHETPNGLHGFLVTAGGSTSWKCKTRSKTKKRLGTLVSDFLRDLGNYDANHQMTTEQLASTDWQKSGDKLYQALFAGSSLDPGALEELIVVPDGVVWYVPLCGAAHHDRRSHDPADFDCTHPSGPDCRLGRRARRPVAARPTNRHCRQRPLAGRRRRRTNRSVDGAPRISRKPDRFPRVDARPLADGWFAGRNFGGARRRQNRFSQTARLVAATFGTFVQKRLAQPLADAATIRPATNPTARRPHAGRTWRQNLETQIDQRPARHRVVHGQLQPDVDRGTNRFAQHLARRRRFDAGTHARIFARAALHQRRRRLATQRPASHGATAQRRSRTSRKSKQRRPRFLCGPPHFLERLPAHRHRRPRRIEPRGPASCKPKTRGSRKAVVETSSPQHSLRAKITTIWATSPSQIR